MGKRRRRGWSRLPIELLQEIASHISEVTDRIRFRSVCVSWRSASKSMDGNHPQRFPWLYDPCAGRLALLSENRAVRAKRRRFSGSAHHSPSGWTIVVPSTPINGFLHPRLRNPMIRCYFQLPPLPVPSWMRPDVARAKIFGTNLVALQFQGLHFCRIGETAWKTIQCHCDDFAYHDGRFYAFCGPTFFGPTGGGRVFHPETLQEVAEIPPWLAPEADQSPRRFLVESTSGDLLQVLDYGRQNDGRRFRVLRLEGGAAWAEVGSIGDGVLFVDAYKATCVAASDFKGCRGSCIYFMECYGVRLFDIGRRRVEKAVFSGVSLISWTSSLWVFPSLRLDFGLH